MQYIISTGGQAGSCATSSHELLHEDACRNNREEVKCEYYKYVDSLESFSDEADNCVSNLHAYQKGEKVQVFSHTARGWVEGQVVDPVIYGRLTVDFEIPGHGRTLFRKHMLPTSQQLHSLSIENCCTRITENNPGSPFVNNWEARSALDDFVVCLGSPDLTVEEMPKLSQVFHLVHEGNNAFKASLKCPVFPVNKRFWLSGPFSIAYKPERDVGCIIDVVLKVHALPAKERDEHDHYKPLGFVHTLLHKEGEKVYFHPDENGIAGPFYLGFTVNKDLSVDLRDRMRANEKDRAYFEGLFERFKVTWNIRGDAQGETLAENADYLISYTGRDKDENYQLLQELTTKPVFGPHVNGLSKLRPIKFCTDRSAGFGVHFYQRGGSVDDEFFTLNLGKHGFAQPLEDGTWWDEYRNAVMKTKCGMLVLNPSPEYFQSRACLKEWNEIPQTKKWMYNRFGHRITGDPYSAHLMNRMVTRCNGDPDAMKSRANMMMQSMQELGFLGASRIRLEQGEDEDTFDWEMRIVEAAGKADPLAIITLADKVPSMLAPLAEKGNVTAIIILVHLIGRVAPRAEEGNPGAIIILNDAMRALAASAEKSYTQESRELAAVAEKGDIEAISALADATRTLVAEKSETRAEIELAALAEKGNILARIIRHNAEVACGREHPDRELCEEVTCG